MVDICECSVLILLDVSAAFDTVDHKILIDRLHQWVGISGMALNWFCSYLKKIYFYWWQCLPHRLYIRNVRSHCELQVAIRGTVSSHSLIKFGVPQGLILGPILSRCICYHLAALSIYIKCNSTVTLMTHSCISTPLQSDKLTIRYKKKNGCLLIFLD